jgi:hypothetical protein
MTTTQIPTAMRGVSTVSINRTLAAIASFGERNETPIAPTAGPTSCVHGNIPDGCHACTTEPDLLDLVPDAPVDLRSTAQIELMNRLMAELRDLDPAAAAQGDDYMHGMTMSGLWTSGRDGNASRWIDRLIAKLRSTRAAKRTQGVPAGGRVELEDGVYRVEGTFYMVQHAVHGSGNQYAKRIEITEDGQVSATYAAGMIRNIRPEHRITGDEAAAFGQVYGVCVFCIRPLTDERSKAVGYGRKCADNHGLPWG